LVAVCGELLLVVQRASCAVPCFGHEALADCAFSELGSCLRTMVTSPTRAPSGAESL